jgi:hypothetical protein
MSLIENGVEEATALSTLGLSPDEFDRWRREEGRLRLVRLDRDRDRAVAKLAAVFRQRVDSKCDDAASPDAFINEVAEALRRALSGEPDLFARANARREDPLVADAAAARSAPADRCDGSERDPPPDHFKDVA